MKIRELIGGVILCCLPQTSLAQHEAYYISKVPKYSVEHFLERFATATHHIVVTTTPPHRMVEQIKVTRAPAQHLYALELINGATAPHFIGEVGRIDNMAFVVITHHELTEVVAQLQADGYHPIAIPDEAVWHPAHRTTHGGVEAAKLSFVGAPEISTAFIQQRLEQLAGERPVNVGGVDQIIKERHSTAGKNLARAFLKQEFEKQGYTVTFHRYPNDSNPQGINFIAERRGTDDTKTLLLSSHLDSVTTGAADDNGSGTITLLAAASVLKSVNLRYRVRFVAFDQEEDGLVGSKAYARMLTNTGKLSELVGVINIDTAGYDSDNDGKFHVIDCDESNSTELAKSVETVLSGSDLPLTVVPYCTNRSDHATFWKYEIPAVTVSENYFKGDPNPCMHKSCDTTKNINFGYLTRIIRLVTATALSMAGPDQ